MQLNAEPVPQEPGTSRAPLSRKVSAYYAASEGPGGVLRWPKKLGRENSEVRWVPFSTSGHRTFVCMSSVVLWGIAVWQHLWPNTQCCRSITLQEFVVELSHFPALNKHKCTVHFLYIYISETELDTHQGGSPRYGSTWTRQYLFCNQLSLQREAYLFRIRKLYSKLFLTFVFQGTHGI